MRSWQNGESRQAFTIADAPYSIGEIVELATTVMTLHTGDVLLFAGSGNDPDRFAAHQFVARVEREIAAAAVPHS